MKLLSTTRMKYAAVTACISIAFVSQASAVLRPLFPIKPTAPSNDELTVIGDELVLRAAKKSPIHHHTQAH